ncbi:hypothetical protein [Veillonella magna]|uniref:DUF1659 domain-containing protein n=1 Tax=Veillonella magna TaxID=464322 RepID=UPI0023F15DCB|nr:hypothetical protein [Veillonella magna]MBD8975170.1 hypothetical protein [Veillonella magna]
MSEKLNDVNEKVMESAVTNGVMREMNSNGGDVERDDAMAIGADGSDGVTSESGTVRAHAEAEAGASPREDGDVIDHASNDESNDGANDESEDAFDDETEERGPSWDVVVAATKVQLRLNMESEGASKVKLVAFNNISPKKTDEELNILCDKLASLFAYPSVGFVRINTITYKPQSVLFK